MNTMRLYALVLSLLPLLSLPAQEIHAQQSAIVDRRAFFGEVQIAGAAISPDGKHMTNLTFLVNEVREPPGRSHWQLIHTESADAKGYTRTVNAIAACSALLALTVTHAQSPAFGVLSSASIMNIRVRQNVQPSMRVQTTTFTTRVVQRPFIQRYRFDGKQNITPDPLGSTYITMDSWMYPALLRLYSLGYLDTAFLSLRPWTRRSVLHMLDESEGEILSDNHEEAVELLDKLYYALRDEPRIDGPHSRGAIGGTESAYAGVRIVSGTVLRDSWNLGQSFNDDYGRPYSTGLNSYNGLSGIAELGPFSLYVRGEYQHAPSYKGYSYALAAQLSAINRIPYPAQTGPAVVNPFGGVDRPQATIPEGPLPSENNLRLIEANVSVHAIGHEISLGKSDAWLGPGIGGAMAWSNNAENIYSLRINRVEPLHIPYLSRVVGDFRYDFFIGSLKGHTYPRDPWIHSEIIAFAPTRNFQMSFQRSIIFGGAGHAPVTLHTFLKGFVSTSNIPEAQKLSRDDPGARFSSFTFSYRLPFARKYATVYTDSITHDDVFPISAPRRAGWRPGLYLPQLPFAHKLSLRSEATYTDYPTSRSTNGEGNYQEEVQRQGYTNKGFNMADWVGREAKGGQTWLTYQMSGNESLTLGYLRKKNAKDFIPGGTTQNIYRMDMVKRLGRDVEVKAWFQAEQWKAPIWRAGAQGSTTGAFQLTWYPTLRWP